MCFLKLQKKKIDKKLVKIYQIQIHISSFVKKIKSLNSNVPCNKFSSLPQKKIYWNWTNLRGVKVFPVKHILRQKIRSYTDALVKNILSRNSTGIPDITFGFKYWYLNSSKICEKFTKILRKKTINFLFFNLLKSHSLKSWTLFRVLILSIS